MIPTKATGNADSADQCFIGVDVGGANIKLAQACGRALSRPFALWQAPERLAAVIGSLLREAVDLPSLPASAPVCLGLTMTGELADCFANKATGVRHILNSVAVAAHEFGSFVGRVVEVKVFSYGGFVSTDQAAEHPHWVAAANWWASGCAANALAASADVGGWDLLIDCGSTTTDLVPLADSRIPWPLPEPPFALGEDNPCWASTCKQPGIALDAQNPPNLPTDFRRLVAEWLIYTGVKRSSLSGILDTIELSCGRIAVANEYFATAEDAYIYLGKLPVSERCDTADAKPKTKLDCARRIARLVCGDLDEVGEELILAIAEAVFAEQRQKIARALKRVLEARAQVTNLAAGQSKGKVLVCGEGEFLAIAALLDLGIPQENVVMASQVWGNECSTAFPAFAVALLCRDQFH